MRVPALLALTLFAACAPNSSAPCETDADCETGVCRLGGCGPECLDALDCGSGEACVEGACVPAPQCATANDCAPGFACEDGQCRCTGDPACARNEACVAGACLLRPPCTSNVDCAGLGLRCDLAQGLCVSPCSDAADCATGVDPTLASLLYLCADGTCQQRCFNDATCGGELTCRNGVCTGACRARSDCATTDYCTSAAGGTCEPYLPCAGASECPAGNVCEAFSAAECPPGVDCAQPICRPLPSCVFDADCAAPAYCEERHCRPSTSCDPASCPDGQRCVAHLCVPGGCRGHAECGDGETCSEGACVTAAAAADVVQLQLWPRRIVLQVGETLPLTAYGVRAEGAVVPVGTLAWSVVDGSGAASGRATVDGANVVHAVAAGSARARATLAGSPAAAAEVTLALFDPAAMGRRKVIVVEGASHVPLAGVSVTLCDGPALAAPCAAPVEATTGADGSADLASTAATVSVTVVSPEVRADGAARYDRVSVLATSARTLLVPLDDNAVASAAGMTGTLDFAQAQGEGAWSLGLVTLAIGAPWELSPRTLLGETYQQALPGLGARVPLPAGSVVAADLGFGAFTLKGTADVVRTPGTRTPTGFGGRFDLPAVAAFDASEFARRVQAMDYAVASPLVATPRALVADTVDRDGDGLCENATTCPSGTERLPDFASFPSRAFTPSREQRRRTEVLLPAIPATFDAVLVSALQLSPARGLAVLGLGVPPAEDPLAPVQLRSGAPYAGAEFGLPGLAAVAFSEATPDLGRSLRLVRGDVLPTRAVVPDFLPVASGTTSARTFSPQQPQWNATVSAGASLARLTFTGASSRHVVYLGVEGGLTSVYLPAGAAGAEADPLDGEVTSEVALLSLGDGSSADGVFDLSGVNLLRPTEWVTGAAVTP